jgi:hypothetical protein
VFAPISAIFSLLFLASTLPNGIRLNELPAEGNSIEILAGYSTGNLTGLFSTAGATALLLDTYAAGGNIEFINDQGRTAFRITAPKWAQPTLADRLPALFREVPEREAQARQRAASSNERPAPAVPDFREKVEEEIRGALLGANEQPLDFATDEAFVLITTPAPSSLRDALASIPKRGSGRKPDETIDRLSGERTLKFKPELPNGGVIFASPIPGVYYKEWYSVLLLDRLIHRIVPVKLTTTMPLNAHPYYYRLEVAVPLGQFPEAAQENLLQELQRLQLVRASAQDLDGARQEALAYLDSKAVREWFASHDLLSRRDEGVQWIQMMSADDMRVAARDLLITNRVIATWDPRAKQTSVTSEPLTPVATTNTAPARTQSAPKTAALNLTAAPFPAHTDAPITTPVPERLPNGVSLVASNTNAVFVSGASITRFDREPTADDIKLFDQYRSERILVLTPASSLDHARQLWNSFKGSSTGPTGVSRGKVSGGDLGALLVLKTIVDLKVIQSGWWQKVAVRIDADEGSDLQIKAGDEEGAQILTWIKAIANTPPPDADFALAREIAIHRFDLVRADLQALLWERDPQGMIQGLETISPKHVQDVARIYF